MMEYMILREAAMSEPRYKYIYGCREADEHYRSYGATYNWGMQALMQQNTSRII